MQAPERLDRVGVARLRRIAPQDDVDPAAGHVRGDRHGRGAPGLGDDLRLLLMVLGVQHLVRDPAPAQQGGQGLALLDRPGADEHRAPLLVPFLDLGGDRLGLGLLVLVNEVGEILPDHRPVGRNRDHRQVVDLGQLRLLGLRRPGHAGQLVVHPEVVLERDRRQGLALFFDPDPFLGLDRLVETVAVAAAEHEPPGELIDDDHLAVLDHVLDVAVVERVGAQRLLRVVHQLDVLRVGQVVDPQQALHRGDALFGQDGGPELLVDMVVLVGLEPPDELGEPVVLLHGLFHLAGDNQRRARLVDQDEVDLVDDRVVQFALDQVLAADHHVVPEVIEPELVVRPIRDVRKVGLAARHRPEVIEPVVAAADGVLVRRIIDPGELVGDHADAEPEQRVDGAHPACAHSGEVVVGGDEVPAAPLQGVQHERKRRHQRLALAGLHLRDLPAEEHRAADQLHVVVALAEGPLARLAHERERFRHQGLQRFSALGARPQLIQLAAEGRLGQAFELPLERVDLGDQRFAQLFNDPLARVPEERLQQLQHRQLLTSAPTSACRLPHSGLELPQGALLAYLCSTPRFDRLSMGLRSQTSPLL